MQPGKLIIFSAPSGSGKSTIINYLLTQNLNLAFSISATSRAPRGEEKNGVEYYFLTPDKFYGTLKSEVERLTSAGKNVIFDVDVVGGVNIKRFYGERALSIFIQPPGIEELRRRLTSRATDAPEVIESRLAKAEYEMGFAPKFDRIVVNDDLSTAEQEVLQIIKKFLDK